MTLCARHAASGVIAEDVHPATNERAGVASRHRAMVRARMDNMVPRLGQKGSPAARTELPATVSASLRIRSASRRRADRAPKACLGRLFRANRTFWPSFFRRAGITGVPGTPPEHARLHHGHLIAPAHRHAYRLGQLAQPIANIRVLDLVVRAHQLQRLALVHGIGLVTRRFCRPAVSLSSR